jgi:hypothetical protein
VSSQQLSAMDHVSMSGLIVSCFELIGRASYINGCDLTKKCPSHLLLHVMAPIALGSLSDRYIHSNGIKKLEQPQEGFGTRAVHVGSDPDPSTGAVIPAISLSTTYKQHGIGNHKVRVRVMWYSGVT